MKRSKDGCDWSIFSNGNEGDDLIMFGLRIRRNHLSDLSVQFSSSFTENYQKLFSPNLDTSFPDEHLENTKLRSVGVLRTEMSSNPQIEIDDTSPRVSVLCDSLRFLTTFLF